jgi:hypothetical protein
MSDPLAHIRTLAAADPTKWGPALAEHERQLAEGPPKPNAPSKLPPLREMAANFVVDAFIHVLNGLPRAPWGLAARRMRICKKCPLFIAESERCSKCGCFLSTKTAWKLSSCPEGKW